MIYTNRLVIDEKDIISATMSDSTIDIMVKEIGNIRIESNKSNDLITIFKEITAKVKNFRRIQ